MKAKFIYETLGFTEDSDPIKDMEIGHDAQMAKLDKEHKWDWSVNDYPFKAIAGIIDIIEYREYHLKIVKVMPLQMVRDRNTGDPLKYFYIAITDIGEPYVGDGPYSFDTAEKAIKSGKSGLDNYIDD